MALLQAVNDWLPTQVRVSVVGDCEFGRCPLIAYLRQMDWDYALRQVGSHAVWWQGNGRWRRVASHRFRQPCHAYDPIDDKDDNEN